MPIWNPWHGCQKLSEGCENCYVYRTDEQYGRDSTDIRKTKQFDLPIRKKRDGSYRIPAGSLVYTCFTSDFLLDRADIWRNEAWAMMHDRQDLTFMFITKRIGRFMQCIPFDWGEGYTNVRVYCTVENQKRADERLPYFKRIPIKYKGIVCEPILSPIDLSDYFGPWIEEVVVGGESGQKARVCKFDWILDLRSQCVQRNIPFTFRQTGYRFYKDGKLYRIGRKHQHAQARKANIDYQVKQQTHSTENHSLGPVLTGEDLTGCG